MIFSDLYATEVPERLDDAAATKWTAAMVKRAVNRVYRDMTVRARLIRRHMTWVANGASTKEYIAAASTEVAEIQWVGSATYQSTFEQISLLELFALDPTWATTTGTPYRFAYGDYGIQTSGANPAGGGAEQILRLYPDPGTALTDVAGVVVEVPAALVNAGDEPRIASNWHDGLADGAAAYLYAQMGKHRDAEAAAYWAGLYEEQVRQAAMAASRQFSSAPVVQAPRFF